MEALLCAKPNHAVKYSQKENTTGCCEMLSLPNINAEIEAVRQKEAEAVKEEGTRGRRRKERISKRRSSSLTRSRKHKSPHKGDETPDSFENVLAEFATRGRFIHRLKEEEKENDESLIQTTNPLYGNHLPTTAYAKKKHSAKKTNEEPSLAKAVLIRSVLDGPAVKETRKVQSVGGVPKTKNKKAVAPTIARKKDNLRSSLPNSLSELNTLESSFQHEGLPSHPRVAELSSNLSPRSRSRRRRSKSMELPRALEPRSAETKKGGRRKKKRRSSLAKTVNFITDSVLTRRKKKQKEEDESEADPEEHRKAVTREKYFDAVSSWRRSKRVLYEEEEADVDNDNTESLSVEKEEEGKAKGDDGDRQLRGGSMAALVAVLIEEGIDGDGIVKNMATLVKYLLAFGQWITPIQLFDILVEGYFYGEITEEDNDEDEEDESAGVVGDNIAIYLLRLKIAVFLVVWMEISFETDFQEDVQLLERAGNFFDRMERDVLHHDWSRGRIAYPGRENLWLLQKVQEKENLIFESLDLLAKECEKKNEAALSRDKKKLVAQKIRERTTRQASDDMWMHPLAERSVLEFSTSKLAVQISKREFGLLQKVRPHDFHHLAFSKPNASATDPPHVLEMISRWNQLSNWVTTQVVICTVDSVVPTLSKFIKLARVLVNINNFEAAYAVFAGLNRVEVTRLKVAWERLPESERKGFANLGELLSCNHNFTVYRYEMERRWNRLGIAHCYDIISQENANNEVIEKEAVEYTVLRGASTINTTSGGGSLTPRKREKKATSYPLIPCISLWAKDFTAAAENPDYLTYQSVDNRIEAKGKGKGKEKEKEKEKDKEKEKEKDKEKVKRKRKEKREKKRNGKKTTRSERNQERMVNWAKVMIWGELLLTVKDLQKQSCHIEYNFEVDSFLENNLYFYHEKRLERKSKKLQAALLESTTL